MAAARLPRRHKQPDSRTVPNSLSRLHLFQNQALLDGLRFLAPLLQSKIFDDEKHSRQIRFDC
jgi:hypothetical protein